MICSGPARKKVVAQKSPLCLQDMGKAFSDLGRHTMYQICKPASEQLCCCGLLEHAHSKANCQHQHRLHIFLPKYRAWQLGSMISCFNQTFYMPSATHKLESAGPRLVQHRKGGHQCIGEAKLLQGAAKVLGSPATEATSTEPLAHALIVINSTHAGMLLLPEL